MNISLCVIVSVPEFKSLDIFALNISSIIYTYYRWWVLHVHCLNIKS